MFKLNSIDWRIRGLFAMFVMVGAQCANAATAGMCHYMTNTVIQNVTGYDLMFSGQTLTDDFGIHPDPSTAVGGELRLPTGASTGFVQTWGIANADTGGQFTLYINDGQLSPPRFVLDYWSGVGANPDTVADAGTVAGQQAAETLLVEGSVAYVQAGEIIAVPPPGDAVIATVDVLIDIGKIAADIIKNLDAEAYLNVVDTAGNQFPNVSNVSINSSQTNTAVVPGVGSTVEEQNLNGYVVSATAVNNGCPNSWNVMVAPYCAYVCGYASANNTQLADQSCANTTYCTQPNTSSQSIGTWLGKKTGGQS